MRWQRDGMNALPAPTTGAWRHARSPQRMHAACLRWRLGRPIPSPAVRPVGSTFVAGCLRSATPATGAQLQAHGLSPSRAHPRHVPRVQLMSHSSNNASQSRPKGARHSARCSALMGGCCTGRQTLEHIAGGGDTPIPPHPSHLPACEAPALVAPWLAMVDWQWLLALRQAAGADAHRTHHRQ